MFTKLKSGTLRFDIYISKTEKENPALRDFPMKLFFPCDMGRRSLVNSDLHSRPASITYNVMTVDKSHD